MDKSPLPQAIQEHLDTIAHDGIDIFMLEEGTVRACALHGTRMVNEMRGNHGLGILETLALGYAYIGAALCTSQAKDTDRLTLSMDCDGPLRGFSVECNTLGQVRGYLKVDQLMIDSEVESFDLAPYIGNGTMSLTRFTEERGQPFTGTVELVHKSIARDLTHYFQVSEQVHTAISLSVYFDHRGFVLGAGGLFLQAMPGADEVILEDLEDLLHEIPSIAKSFAAGTPPSRLMHDGFRMFDPQLVGSRDLEFYCPCERNRFLSYLKSLPLSERDALKEHDPAGVTIQCHNCSTYYFYPHEEVDKD